MNRPSFFSVLFPGVYVVAVLAAMFFMYATAHQTAFCGLYAYLVTLPWSHLIFSTVKVPASPMVFGVPLLSTLVIGVSALMNGALLYLLGCVLDGRHKKRIGDRHSSR